MTGEKLLDSMEFIDSTYIMESYIEPKRHFRPKKRIMVLMVAVMILALGATTMAAITNEWDIAIANYMGISDADTLQLADGSVGIDVKNTQLVNNNLTSAEEEITLCAASSIGDSRNVYIRINTNIKIPEGFAEEVDYIMPEEFSVYVGDKPASATVLEGKVESGYVYYMLLIEDTDNLNREEISLQMGDFALWHEEEPTMLYEGTWDLQWEYSYQSQEKTYRINERIVDGDIEYTLKKIVVTPMEIKAYGRVSANKEITFEDIKFEISQVILKDGTVIDTAESGGAGYHDYELIKTVDSWVNMVQLGHVLSEEEMYSIVIGETEIVLN